MPLVNMNEILKDAQTKKYAVGSFNVTNLEFVRGIIAAAEEVNSPVIIQYAEVHDNYVSLDTMGKIMIEEAKKATVPVVVHLDHGATFENITKAMKLGFTSVMIDASHESFEDNVAHTKEIVKIANVLDVTVEAEIGMMNREGGGEEEFYENIEDTFTDPEVAKEFADKTGVDMLAVSFGTVHGVYTREPNLDFDRLRKIYNKTAMPLVMHGGSGLSDEEYQKAVENGVCKINYYSTMAYNVANLVKDRLNNEKSQVFISDVSNWVIDYVKDDVIEKLKVFGSAGMAK